MADLTPIAQAGASWRLTLTLEEDGTTVHRGAARGLGLRRLICRVDAGAAARVEPGDPLRVKLEATAGEETFEVGARVRSLAFPRDTDSGPGDEPVTLELEIPELPPELAARQRRQRVEILLVGFDEEDRETLERLAGRAFPLLAADDEQQALELLGERPVGVLVVGRRLAGEAARGFLDAVHARYPRDLTVNLVLAGGRDLTPFQEPVDEERLFYLTQHPVFDTDLVAILRSAVERWWLQGLRSEPVTEHGPGESQGVHRILEASRRISIQRDVTSAGELTVEAIEEVLEADRAYYLVYDADAEVLWAGDPDSPALRQESAAVGLVSFVARTGRPVLRDRIGEDPRWERDADDPHGEGEERFLAVPVRGGDHRVRAVLAAVRDPGRPAFEDDDLALFQLLADHVASTFSQLILEMRLERAAEREREQLREGALSLFREEALDAYTAGAREHGELLRLSPRWTAWSYRLLVVVFLGGLAFTLLGTVREFAAGPAVVRMPGNQEIRATTAGTVTAVEVESGQRVEPGDQLVHFYGAQELAELKRIERQFELELVNRLRDPADPGPEGALVSLRAQRELAEARLEERTLRAPAAGVVGSIRVRPGQHVAPGQTLLSLTGERAEPTVVALLPGQYLPQLEEGMPLRLELSGYDYGYQQLRIEEISEEVLGPAEARRYLGTDLAATLVLQGPVVLVESRLGSPTFEADGRIYTYHDGMYARAEVPVRKERILVALFPALKSLQRAEDD